MTVRVGRVGQLVALVATSLPRPGRGDGGGWRTWRGGVSGRWDPSPGPRDRARVGRLLPRVTGKVGVRVRRSCASVRGPPSP